MFGFMVCVCFCDCAVALVISFFTKGFFLTVHSQNILKVKTGFSAIALRNYYIGFQFHVKLAVFFFVFLLFLYPKIAHKIIFRISLNILIAIVSQITEVKKCLFLFIRFSAKF